jgi:phosphoribosylformylglycinamidine synthase
LSNGLNPHYSRWDAYWMSASAIDEAIRNLVAVGGRLDRIAILDNFCAGDPQDPEILGELVRCSQACYDFAKAYDAPFISGKDSLNNQFLDPKTGRKKNIPTTLLISAVSLVEDVRKLVSMDFKRAGNLLYVLGVTKDELGGSQYGLVRESLTGKIPQVDAKANLALYAAVSRAMDKGLIASCHDCSDGGIGVALAEMALAGELGAAVDLAKVPVSSDLQKQKRADKVLFSESNGRFIAEVSPKFQKQFEATLKGLPVARIGKVASDKKFRVKDAKGKTTSWSVDEITKAWTGGVKP